MAYILYICMHSYNFDSVVSLLCYSVFFSIPVFYVIESKIQTLASNPLKLNTMHALKMHAPYSQIHLQRYMNRRLQVSGPQTLIEEVYSA